jgi:hypothetical protein
MACYGETFTLFLGVERTGKPSIEIRLTQCGCEKFPFLYMNNIFCRQRGYEKQPQIYLNQTAVHE